MLEILTGENNPILRKKSQTVTKFDKKLKKFIEEMKKKVIEVKGLGLAAPQAGMNERLFLMRIKDKFITVINPRIIRKSEETIITEEGCLSLPDTWGDVKRSKVVTVSFQDESGSEKVMQFSDIEAVEAQHEYDHLEGVLFTDKLCPNIAMPKGILNSEA